METDRRRPPTDQGGKDGIAGDKGSSIWLTRRLIEAETYLQRALEHDRVASCVRNRTDTNNGTRSADKHSAACHEGHWEVNRALGLLLLRRWRYGEVVPSPSRIAPPVDDQEVATQAARHLRATLRVNPRNGGAKDALRWLLRELHATSATSDTRAPTQPVPHYRVGSNTDSGDNGNLGGGSESEDL